MDLWERLDTARVASLASLRPDGRPHLVPVVFARIASRLVTAVDGKQKVGRRLQRLLNLESNPAVSLLVHHYEEDWRNLWWVRVDGVANVLEDDLEAFAELRARYRQYETVPLPGPVISIAITEISGWPE